MFDVSRAALFFPKKNKTKMNINKQTKSEKRTSKETLARTRKTFSESKFSCYLEIR